jgi:hypothetical protein
MLEAVLQLLAEFDGEAGLEMLAHCFGRLVLRGLELIRGIAAMF